MSNYCVVPPYVQTGLPPNILLMMDNNTFSDPVGLGMQDPAYCTVAPPPTSSTSLIICTDQYDPTKTYSGYFHSEVSYCASNGEWVPSSDNLCAGSVTVSGNILNWAGTSKFDLLEGILVGGVSTSRTSNPNDLHFTSNSWKKTLRYQNRTTGTTYKCIFNMDTVKGLDIEDAPDGQCGYLDNPAHPFDNTNYQIVASAASYDHYASADFSEGARRTAFARIVRSFAGKVFGAISAMFDFFSSDAEAKNLAIQGGSSKLNNGDQCVSGYSSGTITASGGSGSGYVWSISAGSLPAGLTLTNTSDTPAGALISGTPTASGPFSFTLQVTDSSGNTDYKSYSLNVTAATVTITTTSPMPAGTETVWYRESIQATSACTGTNSWTITSGSLPSGLTMDSTDGSIYTYVYGTPSSGSAGTYNFTVRVTDSQNNTASQAFSLTIDPATSGFRISTTSPLPSGTEGVVYPATSISTSGSPCGSCCGSGCGWTWSITSGSIPPGLTFNASSGSFCYNGDHTYITGTPSNGSAGTYTFTISVQDCKGSNTASKTFSLTINPKQATRNPIGPAKKVCVSNTVSGTTYDCNTVASCTSYSSLGTNSPCYNASYCSGSDKCILRSGIVDQFWAQARFGLIDFQKSQNIYATPNIEYCTSTDPTTPNPDSNFLNQIENAVPIDPTTTLINGAYSGINDYYAQSSSNNLSSTSGGCDPIDSHPCRKNFVLMITAGVGADNPPNPGGGTPSILPNPPMPASCSASTNVNLTKNSCFGSTVDVRNAPTYGKDNKTGNQNVLTYVVNTMGTPWNGTYDGSTLPTTTGNMLYQAAVEGGGIYYGVTDPTQLKQTLVQAFKDILSRAAAGTAASVLASGEGSGANLIQAVFYPKRRVNNVDLLWTGRLTNYWYYVDPFFQSSNIYEDTDRDRYLNLSDDNMIKLRYDTTLQATLADIYPPGSTTKTASVPFEETKSLWEAGVLLFNRDVTSDKRKIFTTIDGGTLLSGNFSADTNNSSDYTGTNSDSNNSSTLQSYLNLPACSSSSASCWDPHNDLNGDGVVDSNDAAMLINYIQGQDYSNLRTRTVTMNLCSSSLTPCTNVCSAHTSTTCTTDSDCPNYSAGETCGNFACPSGETCTSFTGIWKLNDVLNSTPKISSQIRLNAYDKYYSDSTYYDGTSSSFVGTSTYTNRGMVFAGANDGMLHAIKLGALNTGSGLSGGNLAYLGGTNLGREIWSFIPKNALPYLKYLPRNDYCHVYTVDLTPYVFDASIGVGGAGCSASNYWDCARSASTWRTILIGGMRLGGACKQTCTDTNCVQTPTADPSASKGLGYSSYFALDVTDQNHPVLLWEFDGTVRDSLGNWQNVLGFSTTGPSIVRIADRTASAGATASTSDVSGGPPGTKNGRWFVVLGSGPTGNIDTTSSQFMGNSDQNLKLIIFDLLQGPYDPTARPNSTTWVVDTQIPNAFAGSMLNGSMDPNVDYQDDVVYVPYVRQCVSGETCTGWTTGGVGRLITRTDLSGTDVSGSGTGNTALNPANWVWSKVIDGIGPVTAAVAKLYNKTTDQLWLFFGTGRYYYKTATTMDDTYAQRAIYGVQDPCWSSSGFVSACTDSITSNDPLLSVSSDLVDVTCSTCNGLTGSSLTSCMASCDVIPPDKKGWYINLASSTSSLGAERVTTDPLSTSTGVIFFTTLQPYTDACSLGGQTYIWAVTYNTGGSAGAILQGKALIQVSTGAIEQIDLASAFTQAGGRKSTSLEGVPPVNQGLSIMVGPPPVKKVIHMREK